MVRKQWLELKHPFLTCLYCWVIGSRLPSFYGYSFVWPSSLAPIRRAQADLFSQKPVILIGNLSGKWRCTFEPSQDEAGIKLRSPPLGECFNCKAEQLLSFWRKAAASAVFFRALIHFVGCQLCWECQRMSQESQVWELIWAEACERGNKPWGDRSMLSHML